MFLTNWHGYLQGKSVCDQANVQKIDSMQIGEIIVSPPLCPDRMPRIPNVALERIALPKTNPFFFFFALCTLPRLFLFPCGIFAVSLPGMPSVVFCLFDMVSCSWDIRALWGPFNAIATPFLNGPPVTSLSP
jgi:hypothetical protein